MPVEITLPLTPLEQVVADARQAEKAMAAKVEDAKLVLKSAKTAWEEAVGEVFRALDEMIADKRQPSIPFEECEEEKQGEAARNGNDQGQEVDTEKEPGFATAPEVTTVEITSPPPTVRTAPYPGLTLPALAPVASPRVAVVPNVTTIPSWRSGSIRDHLECPEDIFTTLDTFGVYTLGLLADNLANGQTFGLPLTDVLDLYEAIEEVSQEDAEPVKFERDGIKPTIKGKDIPVATEATAAVAPTPAPKKRGRKPKVTTPPTSDPVTPVPTETSPPVSSPAVATNTADMFEGL